MIAKTKQAFVLCLLVAWAVTAAAQGGRSRYAGETFGHLFATLQDSVGSDSMSVASTAVAPGHFYYKVPAGKTLDIGRVLLVMVDGSITPTKFGGLSALTNGVLCQVVDTDSTTVLLDFTADEPITANFKWTLLAGVDNLIIAAAGDDIWSARWTISNSGEAIRLRAGQFFRLVTQDDLSDITSFQASIQGVFQ